MPSFLFCFVLPFFPLCAAVELWGEFPKAVNGVTVNTSFGNWTFEEVGLGPGSRPEGRGGLGGQGEREAGHRGQVNIGTCTLI